MPKRHQTESSYGVDSQHAHFFVKGHMPERPRKPIAELSETDKVKVAEHASNLKKYAPDFYVFVKEAIEAGMAPGLRDVRVKVLAK